MKLKGMNYNCFIHVGDLNDLKRFDLIKNETDNTSYLEIDASMLMMQR